MMFSPNKQVVADLHVHSPFSRAVSPHMTLTGLRHLGIWKGINVLAAGDWTHPVWLAKLQQELQEVRPGVFRVRPEYRRDTDNAVIPAGQVVEPEFLLATEISCIYSQGGKLRRVHLLVWVPSFKAADKVVSALQKRGAKLASDGRPVIGISCRDLTALVLEADPRSLIIPAHAWTPWFGVLGSRGGFDSLEEAFQDLTPHIYALETGLSSDPAMNWRVSEINDLSIVSFGDAHSLPKVGRELTIFSTKGEWNYEDMWQVLAEPKVGANKGSLKLSYTVEFYPEEGKYHWDGHRACQVVQTPAETRQRGVSCPVCGKPLTVGVEFRVDELAAKERLKGPVTKLEAQKTGVIVKYDSLGLHKPPYISIVPLVEIVAEVLGKKVGTQTVNKMYAQLLTSLGCEFEILINAAIDKIAAASTPEIAQAVAQVRAGKLRIEPGFDGVYGKVAIEKALLPTVEQSGLF